MQHEIAFECQNFKPPVEGRGVLTHIKSATWEVDKSTTHLYNTGTLQLQEHKFFYVNMCIYCVYIYIYK